MKLNPHWLLDQAARQVGLLMIAVCCAMFAAFGMVLITPAEALAAGNPTCTLATDGKGAVYGRVGQVAGVAWWCPPTGKYDGWTSARAAIEIPNDRAQASIVLNALNAKDPGPIFALQSLPPESDQFRVLWAAMDGKHRASRPMGPWFVQPLGSASTRQAFDVNGGTPKELKGERVAIGTPCDCNAQRLITGGVTFCRAGFGASVCARQAP